MRPSIIETVVGRRCVLHLSGELDIAGRAALADACARVRSRDARTRLVIDLTHVDFVDGWSLRELAVVVRARQALGDPGVIAVSSPLVRRLLDVTGYGRGAVLAPSLAEALRVVAGGFSPGRRPAAG